MSRFDRRHFIKSGLGTAAATVVPLVAQSAEFFPPSRQESRTGFMAGFGKADITPDRPEPTIWNPQVNIVMDRIHVRSTYFRSGNEQVVIASCDLLGLPTSFTDTVKHDLTQLRIPKDRVAINCSHTHTAPQLIPFRGASLADDAYRNFVKDQIVQSIKDALANAAPATVGFGKVDAPLNVNRVQIGRLNKVNNLDTPSGRVDPQLSVIRINQTKSKKSGLIYNFAAHALTVSANSNVISADYPGYSSELLEAEPDVARAQFIQGCAGDMNPRIHGDQAVTTKFAKMLADYVKQACAGISMESNPKLAMNTRVAHLPYGKIPSLQEVNSILAAEEEKTASSQPSWQLLWARAAKQALEEGRKFNTVDATFQGIRLGDIRIAVMPGEVFAEIGLAIKQQIGGNVITMAYSNNDEVGYIPSAEQFSAGGYEVENAPRRYDLFPWSPKIGPYYVSQAMTLLRSL